MRSSYPVARAPPFLSSPRNLDSSSRSESLSSNYLFPLHFPRRKPCADPISRIHKRPTWGTCAGLILLSDEANATKKGGQELIGGLGVRVHRNHFGRQIESFESNMDLPFLDGEGPQSGFPGVFIRAPVVEEILATSDSRPPVEVLAKLPGRLHKMKPGVSQAITKDDSGDIIAVRQGNVLGTSFHPELTKDARIHVWWLKQILGQ